MPIWQAIVMGIVQGLGEFLPISSSAHLLVVPWMFGWQTPGLAFDVALHWGTLAAVIWAFWADWMRLLRAFLAMVRERKIGDDPDRRMVVALVVATIPAVVIGALIKDWAETAARSPKLVAVTLSVMGLVLWWLDRVGSKQEGLESVTLKRALAIGFAQAAALIPGVSRSGGTISAGLALGMTREAIARFSFLMSMPIILGAGIVEMPKLLRVLQGTQQDTVPVSGAALIAGLLASGISGFIVIRWLLTFLRKGSYAIFALYRGLFAALIVVLLFLRS
jgi:undecaprenyl-diphosphatase